ncbi:Uncharacterized protein TPAR_02261, partial [Tolypocladium paradoxum]
DVVKQHTFNIDDHHFWFCVLWEIRRPRHSNSGPNYPDFHSKQIALASQLHVPSARHCQALWSNNGLPAIPDNLQGMTELAGQATWQMRSTGCTVPCKARNEGKQRWKPARLRPTLCIISGHSCFNHSDSKSNGIASLFFG